MAVDTTTFASSYLAAGEYDSDSQILTITFQDGSQFLYSNVPQGVWEGLKAAGSAGQYFYRQVRGRYGGQEI